MAPIKICLTKIHQTQMFDLQQSFIQISLDHSIVLFSSTWEFCASISNFIVDLGKSYKQSLCSITHTSLMPKEFLSQSLLTDWFILILRTAIKDLHYCYFPVLFLPTQIIFTKSLACPCRFLFT